MTLGIELPPGTPFPAWRPVTQVLPDLGLPDVAGAVTAAIAAHDFGASIGPGTRIAVAVGSRGITALAEVVRTTIRALRALGAEVFVVPAMGSHGGATAEGQIDVLASLGVTEETVGAPIRSSMRTVVIGSVLDGFAVNVDEIAATQADYIVPVNRVKPHTDFRGEVESGIHKMLAIGLGKQAGASSLHSYPLQEFGTIIRVAGQYVLDHLPVLFAVALVEDAHKQLAHVEAIPGALVASREPELLARARRLLPRIPVPALDVLVIGRVGKDISGAGMDPNVSGRFVVPEIEAATRAERVVVLGLTEATHGNAAGIGMADIVTEALFREIDLRQTYVNHMTTHSLAGAKIPVIAATERDAVAFAIASMPPKPPGDLRVCLIDSTIALSAMWATDPVIADSGGLLVPAGQPEAMRFGPDGSLLQWPGRHGADSEERITP